MFVSSCRLHVLSEPLILTVQLLKSEEQASYKPTKKACIQLVDNLVEHILKYEESIAGNKMTKRARQHNFKRHCAVLKSAFSPFVSDCEDKGVNSDRLVACVTTLYLFSKIKTQLMVKHAMTMQPYLTTKCNVSTEPLGSAFVLYLCM